MLRKLLVLGAIVGVTTLAIMTTGAQAGKPGVQLGYQIYSFSDGTFKVDYIFSAKGGSMDLAVSHECSIDGELVQSRTNRVYWSGNGKDKEGHWNLAVPAGADCTAVAIDLDQTDGGGSIATTSSGYMQVSPPVSYSVQ